MPTSCPAWAMRATGSSARDRGVERLERYLVEFLSDIDVVRKERDDVYK
jgi:hypothetical protein